MMWVLLGKKLSLWSGGLKLTNLVGGATIELGCCSEPELCLVFALWEYLQARVDHEGYLFLNMDDLPLTPILGGDL